MRLKPKQYEDFRERHKEELKNNESALKIAVSEHLSYAQFEPENKEIELLRQLGKRSLSGVIYSTVIKFARIYTTLLLFLVFFLRGFVGTKVLGQISFKSSKSATSLLISCEIFSLLILGVLSMIVSIFCWNCVKS